MRLIWSLIFLIFGVSAAAQTNTLFDEASKEKSLTTTFNGRPAVLIESISQNTPSVNQAEKLPPPKWDRDLQIPITTPFGHQRTASFIDHITDFVAFITLLDTQTIQIEETVQFINTDKNQTFNWTLPVNAEFLNLYHHKKQITPTIQNNFLSVNTALSQGAEQFTISYLLHYPVQNNDALTNLMIPITQSTIPLMTERFSVILSLPQKTTLYKNEMLFGNNNQKIPEQVLIKNTDKEIIYQMTHPLPAFTEVKLNIELDTQSLTPKKADYTSLLIMLSYTLILMLYTGLSILTLRHKKWKKILTNALKIDTSLWQAEQNASNRIYHYLKAYFKFNWTSIIEVAILLITTQLIFQRYAFSLSFGYQVYMIFISVLSLILIDKYGTKFSLATLKKAFYTFLMTTPQGLNLSNRVLKSCYQLAVCMGFADEWRKKLIQNNPAYQAYFKEVKKQ